MGITLLMVVAALLQGHGDNIVTGLGYGRRVIRYGKCLVAAVVNVYRRGRGERDSASKVC